MIYSGTVFVRGPKPHSKLFDYVNVLSLINLSLIPSLNFSYYKLR
jgi:hypothetical protein